MKDKYKIFNSTVVQIKRTTAVTLLICILCVFLSGCSQQLFNLDELMHPPKMGEEQAQIYEALTKVVGTNITLRYPKSGENRSAFLMEDLDGDASKESIVFYEDTTRSNIIRINILKKGNGSWYSVYDVAGLSSDIEKIGTVSFSENSPIQLVIGFNLVDGNKKSLVVYDWKEDILVPSFTLNYLYFELIKLGKESFYSLMVVNSHENGNQMDIIKKSALDFAIVAQAPLNPLGKTYSHLSYVTDAYNTTYMYLESSRGVGLSTEIISYESLSLNNLSLSDKVDFEHLTYRPSSTYSKDIDKDGKIEIPVYEILPGFEKLETENKKYYVKWCDFSGKNDTITLNPKLYTYTNNRYNYYFTIPTEWVGKVTVKENDMAENILTFIKYEDNVYFNEEEIFSICVYKNSDLTDETIETLKNQGYSFLLSDGSNKIYGKVNSTENDFVNYKINNSELSKRIRIVK